MIVAMVDSKNVENFFEFLGKGSFHRLGFRGSKRLLQYLVTERVDFFRPMIDYFINIVPSQLIL
jgi:hypothetical protein